MIKLTKTMEEWIDELGDCSDCRHEIEVKHYTITKEEFTQSMQGAYAEGQSDLMRDIAKLFGEDDLGIDGKSWSLGDVEEEIARVREYALSEVIEYTIKITRGQIPVDYQKDSIFVVAKMIRDYCESLKQPKE